MKKKQKISTLLIIVTIVTIGTFFFIGSISSIEAVKRDRTLLADYKNLTKLVGDIKNGDFNDDQIPLNDFKNSVAYQDADENMQDCINLAGKIGHNLGDNEIVHCFENANYFKDKYPNVSVPKAKIPPPEANVTANVPEANVTANVPETNASLNETKSNVTVNVPDANVTANVPETNVTANVPTITASLNVPEPNVTVIVPETKVAGNVTMDTETVNDPKFKF